MPDYQQGFKLCTSNDSENIDQSKPHWLLFRRVPRKDNYDRFVLGTCALAVLEGDDLNDRILGALRQGNCFDRDLNLKQKDKLVIFNRGKSYSFELCRKGWKIYRRDSPLAAHAQKAKGNVYVEMCP